MRDVAALAGVSLKTVSRVVNNEQNVTPELAERVQAASEQLGFRPNLGARSLRQTGQQTRMIGLLLEDVSNPFSAALHRSIESVARTHGVSVLTGSVNEDAASERTLVRDLIERRVDGLIIMPASDDHSYLAPEQRAGTPIVFVDRPPQLLRADVVVTGNRIGSAAALRHLLAHGHRRIAFLGDLHRIHTMRLRYEGYREALLAADLEVDPELIVTDLQGTDQGRTAVAALLDSDNPPTAIFAGQNLLTIGAIRELRARGLQHKVALVGFDDFELADLLEPAVTVVAQDPDAIGNRAATQLFARLAGDTSPAQVIELATTLIARGSGEIRA